MNNLFDLVHLVKRMPPNTVLMYFISSNAAYPLFHIQDELISVPNALFVSGHITEFFKPTYANNYANRHKFIATFSNKKSHSVEIRVALPLTEQMLLLNELGYIEQFIKGEI